MASKEFKGRMKLARDTSANWEAKNPLLLNGEMILIDTAAGELRAKIGDGTKRYSQLPFDDEAIRNLINNNKYEHPTYSPVSSGLYKITTDSQGHITGAVAVTKSDITALGIASSEDVGSSSIIKSASAPTDTNALWIDTGNGNVAKFHNGSNWVPIPAVWG